MKMKAILLPQFGGADQLMVGETDRPRIAPGCILIKAAATSVNRPDLLQREGRYPPPPGESEILGWKSPARSPKSALMSTSGKSATA